MSVKYQNIIGICFTIFVLFGSLVHAQTIEKYEAKSIKLHNPITVGYLKNNLSKQSPRLILTSTIEKTIKKKLKSDPLLKRYYKYLENESIRILDEPLLERKLQGYRLLAVSREMVERMGICFIVPIVIGERYKTD